MEIKLNLEWPSVGEVSQAVAFGLIGLASVYTLTHYGFNWDNAIICLIASAVGVFLFWLVFGPLLRYPRALAWIIFVLIWNVIPAGLAIRNAPATPGKITNQEIYNKFSAEERAAYRACFDRSNADADRRQCWDYYSRKYRG